MKLYRKKLFFLILIALSWNLHGQYPFYKNLNINDGLISNKVYNIIEDRFGFIWICTDQGVSRYDGVTFVNFNSRDGLPDNEVLSLFEDAKGRIWFNSFSTEPCYYLEGKIYNSKNDSFLLRIKKQKPPGMCMSMIVNDNNSIAFYIVENAKKLLIGKDINDISVLDKDLLRGFLFQNFLVRKAPYYYVMSPNEIVYWKQGDSVQVADLDIWGINYNYTQAPGNKTYGLIEPTPSKPNTKEHLAEIDIQGLKKKDLNITGSFKSFFSAGEWRILNGDSSYKIYNAQFNQLIEESKLPFSYERILVDKKGNKWLGSFDNGIYFIRNQAPIEMTLPANFKNGILAIDQYGEELLLRTEKNGLLALNRKGICRVLYHNPKFKRVRGFARSGKHCLIGTDGGIYRLNLNFQQAQNLDKAAVKDIETESNGEVLIGTASSSLIYRNDSIIHVYTKRTTAICRVNTSVLWHGGLDGIYQTVIKAGSIQTDKLKLHEDIDNSRIVDIKKDKSGHIWVATDQKGLFFCPKNGSEVLRFSETSVQNRRLLSDVCLQILIQNDGRIWLAAVGGASVISYDNKKSEYTTVNYSISEGMPGKTINGIAFWDDEVMLATPNGLYSYKNLPSGTNDAGETVITQIKVNSVVYNQNQILLPYHQNNLIISYASSFINTGLAYTFMYRVKALNPNWIETKTLQVPLLGLESGHYLFEIASVNSQGQLGKISTLNIHIRSPWFRQWWFIGLVICIVLFSLAYYYKLIRDRINLGKNLTLLKLRIMRAQMNPHFVFNSLSNIQRLIHVGELKYANDYIGTLASIMRKSIDYSGEEFIPLDKEIEYTKSYLEIEKLRFEERFNYIIQSKIPGEEMAQIYVPPLLLQPLVENSIKHGFKGVSYKGELSIHIEKINVQNLRYTITDNGIGFDIKKTSGKDYGIGIAKERVELLYKNMNKKGNFTIFTDENKGTKIVIELPILKD